MVGQGVDKLARMALWQALDEAETYIADTARDSVLHQRVYGALLDNHPDAAELAWWQSLTRLLEAARTVAQVHRGEIQATELDAAPLEDLCSAVEGYERRVAIEPASIVPATPANHPESSSYDIDAVDTMALALLSLTMFRDGGLTRAWKGLSWDVLDRLYAKGWIENPVGKAKSVVFTEHGREQACTLFQRYFGT